jgi:streptogramin lyase
MRFALALAVFALIVPVAAGKAPPPPKETAVVQTGRAPCGLAVHRGELWVGVYESGMLLRLDRAGRVRQRIRVGRWACRVAVDDGAVWVTRDNARELVRVDRRTGRIGRTRLRGMPFDVVLAGGSVFVTGYDTGTVSRVDPKTRHVTRVYRVWEKPAGLAFCGGRVWVGHNTPATWVDAIDPATHRVRRSPLKANAPGWPQCLRGALWVTTPDRILRLSPRTGRGRSQLVIAETLADAALGPDGLVWVTDKQHSLVHRLDPSGRQVLDSFPAGPGAFALARAGGAMWITSFAGADVRRYEP